MQVTPVSMMQNKVEKKEKKKNMPSTPCYGNAHRRWNAAENARI